MNAKKPDLSPRQQRLWNLALLSLTMAIVNWLVAGFLYAVGILPSKTSMTLAMLPALVLLISYFLLLRALTRSGPPFDRLRWWWPRER